MGSHEHLTINIREPERKTAILDSNLLLLYICARVGFERFRAFDRVSQFTLEDVTLLGVILEHFRSVITTAYVLAEVSNLANKLTGELRNDWFRELAKFTVMTTEIHVAANRLGRSDVLVKFGVTDAALRFLADEFVVITYEYRLSGYLEAVGAQVINFNHFRVRLA